MSGAQTISIRAILRFMVIAAMAVSIFAFAQSAKEVSGRGGAKEKLIGAWHLAQIDAPGPDGKSVPIPQPKGMLIYTRTFSFSSVIPVIPKITKNEDSGATDATMANNRNAE